MHARSAADFQGSRQRPRGEGEHVGSTRGLSLIIDQPLLPGLSRVIADRLNGSSAEGDGVGGIRDVFGIWGAGRGHAKTKLAIRLQVQRASLGETPALAGYRPAIEPAPLIGAGLEGRDGSKV